MYGKGVGRNAGDFKNRKSAKKYPDKKKWNKGLNHRRENDGYGIKRGGYRL